MQTVQNVEKICKKLKPIFGDKIEKLYLNYLLSPSREEQFQIEKALHALYQQHVSKSLLSNEILLEPPKAEQVAGEYPLGTVRYGREKLHVCSLREKDWVRHTCITGMSGSGKTNFALQIVGNFIFKKKPFLVFDWKKSFRPLLMLNKNLLCFTIGNKRVANFKVNINKPPRGVQPKEWINMLCDIIVESFSANYGVHKVLRETLDKMYDTFGVYQGSENYPTWHQIKDRLESSAMQSKRGRESEWLESALRIAEALTFGNFGESINAKGDDVLIEDLFDKQVIFELNSLNNYEKKFFSEFILTYIYKFKKINDIECNKFNYAIIVDEAHNIFLKDKPNFVKETVTEIIYREIREYGVSLICLDQHISKLSDVVIGNSACHVAFQQQLPTDLTTVSSLMNMYQEKDMFTRIPVGSGIVKLAERFHDPFLIDVPLVKIKDIHVPDEKVKERTLGLLKNTVRKKAFYEQVTDEKLAKVVSKMKNVFADTDVRVSDDFVMEQLKQKKVLADKLQKTHDDYIKRKTQFLRNHMQEFLHDEILILFDQNYETKDIRTHFRSEGYSMTDINMALKVARRNYDEKMKPYQEFLLDSKFSKLNTTQRQFLHLLQTKPNLGTAQIYKFLNLSIRKGDQIKKELVELELLKVVEKQTKNARKKIMQLA